MIDGQGFDKAKGSCTQEMSERCLIFGYGNPARGDDGLGPALISQLEKGPELQGVTLDSNYQLTVEDSWSIAHHDVVIFVDADTSAETPFYFKRVEPTSEISFSSHSVRAEVLLGMAESLFGKMVRGYFLGVRGYRFDMFKEDLSPEASDNLNKAKAFLYSVLKSGEFDRDLHYDATKPNPKEVKI